MAGESTMLAFSSPAVQYLFVPFGRRLFRRSEKRRGSAGIFSPKGALPMKAWVYQDPKQVKKHGEEKTSWDVGWRDPAG